MLINLNDVLIPARRGKYAVGSFNAVNPELTRDVMEITGELDSPAVIGTAEVLLFYGPIKDLANLLIPIAERVSVPVVVHLDHGPKEETYRQALDLESSSIMCNCSTMGYGINTEHVKGMAETVHACGAFTEAEPDHVGDNGGEDSSLLYTDSAQARDFIERTGADALAIVMGMAHGAYRPPPKLDFNRITEITENIPTPLALHGDSGLSDSDFRTMAERGVSKVSISADVSQACTKAVALSYREGVGLIDTVLPETGAVKQSVMEKMGLFESADRGSER